MEGEQVMKNLRINKLKAAVFCLVILMWSAQAWAVNPVPGVRLSFPGQESSSAVFLPSGYTFHLSAWDDDGGQLGPRKYRYLVKEAVVNGIAISSAWSFNQHSDELMPFDDPDWSEWYEMHTGHEDPYNITMPALETGVFYICAVQVMDSDGTVSMDRVYNQSVANFQVSNYFRPEILVYETYLGTHNGSWNVEIASGQPLNFQVMANAEMYGGSIESLRYGWDVIDPDDPNDPGWAIPAGNAEESVIVPERSFNSGVHSLLVQAVDSYGFEHHYYGYLTVVPFVSIENQLPLMMIDQVVDSNSNRWPSSDGSVVYDSEEYRNDFWDFLDSEAGVAHYQPQRDRRDHRDQVAYSDLVRYRSVLITARAHSEQLMFNQFRPENGQDKFVWLAPYQAQGGNLFMVGDRSMESFLEVQNYMSPILFDTDEEYYYLDGTAYVVGFGLTTNPDGTTETRGTGMYPYLTAGISTLDWSTPVGKSIYVDSNPGSVERKAECAGLKALVVADDFRSHHQVNAWDLADTLVTNSSIDWRDNSVGGISSNLEVSFPFTGDEFVDANVTSRSTPWQAQPCDDGYNGYCIEPMYQGVSRYDFKRKQQWDAGDFGWPSSEYSGGELNSICGANSLTDLETPDGVVPNGTSSVNGLTYGYLSYKNVVNKPSGKADVYWGFDPYRFDDAAAKRSVRWVLSYFGVEMR